MELSGSTVLVTGANRGIGRHFAVAARERGARKVYATARRPELIDLPGVQTLALDITDPASVLAAARAAGDVDVLVNNAGIGGTEGLVTGDLDEIRRQVDTHFFGTLGMVRAFAPVLAANGGGAIVNMLSVLSWQAFEVAGGYAAAKAAQRSLTDSVRLELAGQRTQVSAAYLGATDTDMMAHMDVPKNDPAEVARIVLDGIEEGRWEILVDDAARAVKAGLSGDVREMYAGLG